MMAKKKKLTVSLDNSLIKAVKRAAVTFDTRPSVIVEKLLRGWLQEMAPEELAEPED